MSMESLPTNYSEKQPLVGSYGSDDVVLKDDGEQEGGTK